MDEAYKQKLSVPVHSTLLDDFGSQYWIDHKVEWFFRWICLTVNLGAMKIAMWLGTANQSSFFSFGQLGYAKICYQVETDGIMLFEVYVCILLTN